MPNPFVLPDRDEADGRPLCPWASPAHEHLYAPVDHSAQAFAEFQEHLRGDPDLSKHGQVALITGPEGSGKTSLMHRCAWWAKDCRAPARGARAEIIDLTGDDRPGEPTAARVRHIGDRILDELDFANLFQDEEYAALDTRREQPARLYPYLSKLLVTKGAALIVLLPPSEVAEEVREYLRLSQKMILFFCESSYDTVAENARVAGTRPIARFRVDTLAEADGWTFVQQRLNHPAAQGGTVPTIDETTIRKFMEFRITGQGSTTIRELQRTCESVFAVAIEASSPSVALQDFAQYYLAQATL